jgi:hypothetical protein
MTGQYNAEGIKTFIASAALEMYRRVRLDSNGELAYAGATDADCIGTTLRPAFARGEAISVSLHCAEGTMLATSADAFDRGELLYAAAAGKVDDEGSILVGEALDDAAGADEWIEYTTLSGGGTGTPARSSIAMDDLAPYAIAVRELRVWDAPVTPAVAATGANDDLAVVYNTFLTAGPTVETGDVKTANSARKVGFEFVLPIEYVAGETATLRINAGMKTTVSDGTCTVDVQVARRAAPTVDICATNAATINSLVAANVDFTLTPTDLVPGDVLDVVVTITYHDTATGTAVIGQINTITMLLDVKG